MSQDANTTVFAVDGHPDEDQLLLALERELPANDAARVEQHLGTCWSCRARFDEMQRGILAFVEYREKRYLPSLPPFPNDSTSFRVQVRSALSERPAVTLLTRIWRNFVTMFTVPKQFQWVSGMAALMTLVIVWLQVFVNPAAVSANELLTRAIAAENPPAAPDNGGRQRIAHQKVQIRSGQQTIVKDFAWKVGAPAGERPWKVQTDPTAWETPLTAQAFADWRNSVTGQKEDKVKRADHMLTLATTTNQGLIKEAWIVVRENDFHPVEQHLLFADNQQLDFTELAFQISDGPSPRKDSVSPSTLVSEFQASAPAKSPAAVSAPAVDLEEIELELRYTLFINQWDLGEDLVIGRAGGQVTLSGTVSSSEREEAMRAKLSKLPNVQLSVDLPSASGAQPAKPNSISAKDATPLLKDVLDKAFTSREARLAFVDRCLATSDAALSHAWALKRLADRYGDAEEQLLKPESDGQLHEMLRTHLREVNRTNADLQSLLEFLPASNTQTPANSSDWRSGVLSLFNAVQQQDRLVASLLVGSQTDGQNLATSSADFRSAHLRISRLLDVLQVLVGAPKAK